MLKQKYGQLALVAGASEGMGAAFAKYLAAQGMDLILVARRTELMEQLANDIMAQYSVHVSHITCDLSDPNAPADIQKAVGERQVGVLVYVAGRSYVGPFEKNPVEENVKITQTNIVSPMSLTHIFGSKMLERGKGAVVLFGSLTSYQGSGFLATYAATKAFNQILAESLWYEWKDRGVDVIACCPGVTDTPTYRETKPKKESKLAPKAQKPEDVAKECFGQLGKAPSMIPGLGNRMANFFMSRLMPKKTAVNLISDTTRDMYGL